jgi:HD-GYP domain-containing protein (c-di-GMP phosphodiesterase class II)
MFNISDIFSNKDKEKPDKEQPKNKKEEPSGISLLSALSKEPGTINSAKASLIYDEAYLKAKELYRPDLGEASPYKLDAGKAVGEIIDALNIGNRELIKLSLQDYASPEEHLYGHAVNLCILVLDLGLGLGLEGQSLSDLGIAGLLHDIGEVKYLDLINKNAKLSKDEYDRVKEHPQRSAEILSKFPQEISAIIIEAVKQEHERLDGSGYPLGLKDNGIIEYARVISLADVYEAMTHQRPYRSRYTSQEAIKSILNNKNAFDCSIIKVLIERIGIFPAGTFVRLNTKEVALVVKDNPKMPLRPLVSVILDANGKKLDQPRQMDLAVHSVIYIEECLKACT